MAWSKKVNRRAFLKQGTGAVIAGSLVTGVAGAGKTGAHTEKPVAPVKASSKRVLGKTGLTCSWLGMGTGVRSWNNESALTRKGHSAFMEMLYYAYQQGITYFDLADMYGSHPYMREALHNGIDRDKVMISTKTVSRTPERLRADIERFRKELDTDVIDIVLMHFVTDKDGKDWTQSLKPCMDVLADAKARGLIRAHGLSSHYLRAMELAVECPWVDVLLARINPFGVKMDGPVDTVVNILERGHRNGKAILGMKILGEGRLADKVPECIRFATHLSCIDAMTIGFLSPAELDGVLHAFEQANNA